MTAAEKEAIEALVSVAKHVISNVSRQGVLGSLVEKAFGALDKAHDAGLTEPITIATTSGLKG